MASAIRISEPAHAEAIEELVAADRVEIVPLDDEQLSSAWLELASLEGVFCEPASAAGLAALKHVQHPDGTVAVCVVTGHGLKDTRAVDLLYGEATVVEPRLEAILAEVR
jgi:threonine synthase